MNDHTTEDIHNNEDGTLSFLIDALEVSQASVALSKQNIRIVGEDGALFDRAGTVMEVDMTVEGSEEDVLFALQDMIKFIRPYPKGFSRER